MECLYIKVRHIILFMPDIILPYNLPDATLFEGDGTGFMVWQPDRNYIILGQSNTPERSLFFDRIIEDNIPVLKRPSGGEAVLLTPRMIVISIAEKTDPLTTPMSFFEKSNKIIIDTLSGMGIDSLNRKGISDISIGNQKILGSSMRRYDKKLTYHAVLNIGEDSSLMERYLRHPVREPDYRQRRNHSSFVTSLSTEGFNISIPELINNLSFHIASALQQKTQKEDSYK